MIDPSFRVVMLVDSGELSKIIYNGIKQDFNIVQVLVEEDISSLHLIKKRAKRLGLLKTAGQVMFVAFNKIIMRMSARRIDAIKRRYALSDADYPGQNSVVVNSVNDEKAIRLLKEMKPDAVVVNGTRILSEQVLAATDAVFLNTHVGITPRYRGVHGAYWALVHDDKSNCGVTVHLVDKGIDTGGVLYQDTIKVSPFDNLNTYPYRQIAKAIPLMKAALRDVASGNLDVKTGVQPSRLWSHPTLFEYLKFRFLYGVK
ncbi:MAG TPA: formyl transferase [Gammaproteobacteria bacterium]|nr:formyl transferase [Gammaproteobacteria bacterium]